jgi:hypothetical protein
MGHAACMTERKGAYRNLAKKTEGEPLPLRRPKRGWVDNIKIDLKEIGCRGLNWFGLAQDRERLQGLVKTVMEVRLG